MLLAAGAAFDLVAREGGVWLSLGLSRETLLWIASALGVSATILLALGFRRVKLSDTGVRAELDRMEREYAELLERSDATEQTELEDVPS